MPLKSKAQLAKFASLVKEGKLKEATFKEWMSKTDVSKLPERTSQPTKIKAVKKVKSI